MNANQTPNPGRHTPGSIGNPGLERPRWNPRQTQPHERIAVPGVVGLAIALFASACLLPAPVLAQAGVPPAINYQGKLTVDSGNPIQSGSYDVWFRIWDHPTLSGSGDYIWGRSFPVHVVTNGLFNVLLTDDGSDLNTPAVHSLLDAFSGPDRYLGLTVARNPQQVITSPAEISPRQQLATAPFAIHAQTASTAGRASFATNAFQALYASSAGAGQFSVTNGLQVSGTTTLSNALNVIGPATLNGSVALNGSVTLPPTGATTNGGFVPIGGIIMWSGTTAPAGWALCDGRTNNGVVTPDLRGRFVLGYGSGTNLTARSKIGAIGGEEKHTLSADEMPSHSHKFLPTNENGKDVNTILIIDEKNSNNNENKADDGNAGGFGWEANATNAVQLAGGGAAHAIMPPYYVLAFIMRVQ